MRYLILIAALLLLGSIAFTIIARNHNECIFYCITQRPQTTISYKEELSLFMKSERRLIEYRKEVRKKKLFTDPVSESRLFVETFRKESPNMLNNTHLYVNSLLMMLQDNSIEKDSFFNNDVIQLLYNICIEEYGNVIDSVYNLYKMNKVNFSVLQGAVIQNFHLCNQVARNYKNSKLRAVLTRIVEDKTLNQSSDMDIFIDEIVDILSGKEWEIIKESDIVQPPLLKPKECK